MFRMNGIPQAHGCAGAVMFRMNGIPQAHGCAGAVMFRMKGIPLKGAPSVAVVWIPKSDYAYRMYCSNK